MKQKRRFDQGGSIVTFLIVGIILVAGLVGAVYYVNQRGEQARTDSEIASNDDQSSQGDNQQPESDNNEAVVVEEGDFVGDQPVAGLPETGIDLNIYDFLGIFAITFSVTGYLSSKRCLKSHL